VEYSQTWSGGIQHELVPGTMMEVSYMGTWTLGAEKRDGPQRAGARTGSYLAAPADSAVEPYHRDPFDGKSLYHGMTV
jgi:hypothetical protein